MNNVKEDIQTNRDKVQNGGGHIQLNTSAIMDSLGKEQDAFEKDLKTSIFWNVSKKIVGLENTVPDEPEYSDLFLKYSHQNFV